MDLSKYECKDGDMFSTDKQCNSVYIMREIPGNADRLMLHQYPTNDKISGYSKSDINRNIRSGGWCLQENVEAIEKARTERVQKLEEYNAQFMKVSSWNLPECQKIDGTGGCLISGPTANCQISSIYSFATLYPEDAKKRLQALVSYKKHGKLRNMLIVDVERSKENMVEEIVPKEEIVFKNQYTSTNRSLMTMYLFRTSFIKIPSFES